MADPRPTEPVLDLTTLVRGTPINIDGKLYYVLGPQQLTLEASTRLETLIGSVAPMLRDVRKLTPKQSRTLSHELAAITAIIVAAPAPILKRLTDPQRIAVLRLFIDLRTAGASRTGGETTPTRTSRRLTGASPSRASRGSTQGSISSARSRSGSSRPTSG